MKKLTLLSILTIFTLQLLFSQPKEYKILDRININNKLPSKDISAIYNDSKGFIWIGLVNGLCRYDGYSLVEFTFPYDTIAYITENSIFCLYEDMDEIMWIGGENGLFKYDRRISDNISSRFLFAKGIWDFSNGVIAIQDNHKGKLFLGTMNGHALPVFDKAREKFSFINLDPEACDSLYHQKFWITSIIMDSENNLWFGTYRGLFKYNQRSGSISKYMICPDIVTNPVNQIRAICEDNPERLWICTMNGLYAFDKKQEKFALIYPGSSDMDIETTFPVITVKKDKNGKIWFRTLNGLHTITQNDLQLSFNKVYSLQRSYSAYYWDWGLKFYDWGLEFDQSGNVWFGVQNEGINIITKKPEKFRILQPESDDQKSTVAHHSCVFEDKEDNLWIGTWNMGLYKYNRKNNEISHYQHHHSDSNSLNGNRITYIFQDHTGIIWIGTDGFGLNKMINIRDNQVQIKSYMHDPANPAGISNNQIFQIFEDEEDNLWFFNGSGFLDMYDRKRDVFLHLFFKPDCINERFVRTEKIEEWIWLAGWHGIYRITPPFTQTSDYMITPSKLVHYKHDPDDPFSMPDDRLTNSFCASDENGEQIIWYGTNSGLGKMTINRQEKTNHLEIQFKHYGKNNGLNGSHIGAILEDNKGNIWLTTKKGLAKFNKQFELFTNYSLDDIIPPYAFNTWQPCITRDGLIYFPNNLGILVFNPDSMQDINNIPPVYITDFKLFNKSVPVGKNTPLKRPVSYTREIHLAYNQNHITFEYVALDYANPMRNNYKYIMEGLDEDWIFAGSMRTANYLNLKPGKYIFRVQGSNSNGVWNTKGASVKVFIRPPWWKTIVAYISYIVLILLLIGGYVKLHTWRLRKEKDELERLVQERTQQMQEANEELLQQKEEIQTTLEHLRQTQEQLIVSEKMAALGGLVAGVAHEINTPVGITITAASNLKAETEKMAKLYKENKISRAEFMEYMNASNQTVSLILSNMERTATMIQSFKQVSVDQSTEQKRTFKLKSYTEDVIRSLYPKLKKRKVHINLEIDEELEIDSYPGAYSQIITNLVLNSITHGFDEKHRGKIDLKVMHENGELIMEYKDNGKGITKENQKRIYDPFFTTNKKFGTGLGMHIVYNLVTQKLRGNIECISSPGQGVIFKMQIPIK